VTYCANCGNELAAQVRFCSRCGKEVTPPAPTPTPVPVPARPRDWDMHIRILGGLYIATSVLVGILGILVMFAARVLFRMPGFWPPGMPFGMHNLVGSLSSLVGLVMLAIAAGNAIAGHGLMQYRDWARILALVIAVLSVLHFPFGTALSIYTFWVLLSAEGSQHYRNRAQPRIS
jgi:hypothetical protein